MMNHRLSILLAAAALLAACGGGGGGAPPLAHDVPASALASPAAFTSWASGVRADNTAEPLVLTQLDPPTSDTAEPAPLP